MNKTKTSKQMITAIVKAVNDSDEWEAASMIADYLDLRDEFVNAMETSPLVDADRNYCRHCKRVVPTVRFICVGCCHLT